MDVLLALETPGTNTLHMHTQVKCEFVHLLQRNRKVDFIEAYSGKVLIKQEHADLVIIDVRASHVMCFVVQHSQP